MITTTTPFKNEITDEALASKLAAESKAQIDGLAKTAGAKKAPARKAAAKPEPTPAADADAARAIAATRKTLQKVGKDRAALEAKAQELATSERDTIAALRKLGVTWKTLGEDMGMSGVWLQRKHRDLGK